jgi:hypothetical protein
VTPRLQRPFIAILLLSAGCRARVPTEQAGGTVAPTITAPFEDTFDRAELGPVWHNTGGNFRIVDGRLNIADGRNHPLWLGRGLPDDLVMEIDAMSTSVDGDLKVELFGDGESFDREGNRYEATGYMFVFGGWQNMLSIIGRLGEHDDAVKVSRREPRVEPGRTYHWTITKRGGNIDWKIDGQPFLGFQDPAPLGGPGHQFFAINNWKTDVHFDNLRIRPAPVARP